MKKVTTLFAAILLMAVGAAAQKLSYQAVVRNNANELVTETTVQVAVSVLNDNVVQYSETHANVQTNRNGLLSLMIGDGTPTGSTTLAGVVWAGAMLRTVITLPDNTQITTVTPVNSVPYALYTDNVDPAVVSAAIADYIASHNIGGEDNVQADWNVTDQSSDAFIRNKPNMSALNSQLTTLSNRLDSLQAMVDDRNAAIAHLDSVIDFLSFRCGPSFTVTDHEGNVYNTVRIGDQCWMKENLRTTTSPSTGTYLIPASGTSYTYTGKQARWYNNDSATYAPMNYGLLYNWNAAVDTFNTAYGETSVNSSSADVAVSVTFNGYRRGICPRGWHLPSDAEWTEMINYVKSQSEYLCNSNTNSVAKALADSVGWSSYSNTCAVGNNPSANNATGFSAVPAGYSQGGTAFRLAGDLASFRTSSQNESDPRYAYGRSLYYDEAYVSRYYEYNAYGSSVRCLRD